MKLAALAPAGIFVALAGCAGMVKTTQVVDGREVTVWTNPENAERMKQENEARSREDARIRGLEKRKPGDPIVVALFETHVEDRLKKAEKESIYDHLKREFENDPVIRLVDGKAIRAAQEQARFSSSVADDARRPKVEEADVQVYTWASLREEAGIDRATGKAAMGTFFACQGEVVASCFPADRKKTEAKGHILKNPEVTKEFARRLKKIITEDLGPALPSRSALRGGGGRSFSR